jgi:hypothetical protein
MLRLPWGSMIAKLAFRRTHLALALRWLDFLVHHQLNASKLHMIGNCTVVVQYYSTVDTIQTPKHHPLLIVLDANLAHPA